MRALSGHRILYGHVKCADKIAKQLKLNQRIRDLFQEISDMTPWERVGSSLVERKGKTFLEKLGIGEGNFEEQFVNDLAGLIKLVDDAAKNSTPEVQ